MYVRVDLSIIIVDFKVQYEVVLRYIIFHYLTLCSIKHCLLVFDWFRCMVILLVLFQAITTAAAMV